MGRGPGLEKTEKTRPKKKTVRKNARLEKKRGKTAGLSAQPKEPKTDGKTQCQSLTRTNKAGRGQKNSQNAEKESRKRSQRTLLLSLSERDRKAEGRLTLANLDRKHLGWN